MTGKVRCSNCKLTMAYQNITEVVLVCNHKTSSGKKSVCGHARYDAKRIEGQVWFALRKQLELLEKVAKIAEETKENKQTDLEAEQRNLQKTIEDRKAERVRAYENYASGHLNKEAYLLRKSELSEEFSKLTIQLEFLRGESDTGDDIFRDVSQIREKTEQTRVFEKLTRAAVQTFIDVIYVYDVERMEIKFLFDDVIDRVVAYIEQHTNENESKEVMKNVG